MKRTPTLLFGLLIYCFFANSQGNLLIDTTGVPNISNPLVICGGDKNFTIQISNISSAAISNLYFTYDLPSGISYSLASLSGSGITEYNVTNSNKPVFKISSLAAGISNSFTISASADCNVLSVIGNSDSLKANIAITYTKGGITYTENHKSTPITVYEPSITLQVSNNSATANVGDTVTRTVTIVNGGSGSLSNLEFYLVSAADLALLDINNSNYTTNGDTAFISLSGSDFMAFGDGDALFEQNEIISFDEIVIVEACVDLQSNYTSYWGCNNEICQEVNAYSSISVTGSTPNFSYAATSAQSGCYDISIPNTQQLRIVNNGNGPASNIEVEVYQSRTAAYGTMTFFYSYIDDSSFTYKYGSNGSAIKPVVDSTVINSIYDCFNSASPKAYVKLLVPYLDKGDTLYVNWNVYTCCISISASDTNIFGNDKEINGWNYEVTYSNQCQTNTFQSGVKNGKASNKSKIVSQTSDGPSDLNDGDTATYSFDTPAFVLLPGETNKWYFAFEFLIPECLKAVDNSVTFIDKTGWSWPADSIVNHDSVVTAYFGSANKPALFKYNNNVTTSIDITLDCASCSSNGEKDITMNTYYIPSPSCNCESQLGEVIATVTTHCAIACDSGGIWTYYYDIYRTSYGLPDNDNNGTPDSTGSLNMDSIDYRLVMYHDTLSAFFESTVITTTNNPSWKYVYVESTFSEKNVAGVDATLSIFDASANAYYSCTSVPFSQNDTVFTYYLSIDSLTINGCIGNSIPLGFEYENGDSIWFTPRYVVMTNVSTDIYTTFVNNEFYASTISLPDTNEARYSCDNYSGYYNITGFVMDNFGPSEVVTGACDSTAIDQVFRMSVGPCCTNYSGGNIFPYEYRPWTYVKYVKLVIPQGYNFVSATYTFNQTGGTNKKITSVTTMAPDSISNDTAYFDIEKYYQEFGGNSFFISDDGYEAYMSCVILPSCAITPNIIDTIKWLNGFEVANNYVKGFVIPNVIYIDPFNFVNDKDNITSTVPDLSLSPSLAIIQGTDLTASWNFSLYNNSIYSGATNVWVAFESQSGNINIQYLVNTATNDTIYAVGNIFQLGSMNMASLANYDAVCTYTTCDEDSIVLYTGWNCDGYPLSLSSSSCFSSNQTLYLDPQPSKVDLDITQSPTNIDLCDTATYEVKVSSIQLGALQNITVTAEIPYGLYLYANTSELLYPNTSSYYAISNPDSLGNGIYQWNIDANSLLIDSLGLTGISDTTKNYFKLKFDATTNCDFVSGFVVNFTASGEYACGGITTTKNLSSLPLDIKGAPEKQYTSISFSVDNSTLCDTAVKCHVSVMNLGPSTDLSTSHFVFQLPGVYDYVSGSFTNIVNASTMTGPVNDTLNGQVVIDWALPSYIQTGDSLVFEFYLAENDSFVCGTYNLDMFTAQSGNVLCVSSNDSCSVYFISATASDSIDKNKMSLDLVDFSATVNNISATQDNLNLSLLIENTGTLATTDTIFISIYYDADNNGIYSSGDYFLGYTSTTAGIQPGATYAYNDTLSVATGFSCSLIAVLNMVDPGLSCSCLSDEMAYSVSTASMQALADVSICSGESTLIGFTAANNMNYNWSPSTGLSDSTSSQPYINLIDTTAYADTVSYILTVSNSLGGCKVSDTMNVMVSPSVSASIAASTNIVCNGDTVTFSSTSSSTSGITYNWDFGGGSVISGSNAGPYDVTFANSGTILVSLSVSNGACIASDSVSITSGSFTNIFSSTDTSVCKNVSLVLNAGNGNGNYLWSTGDTNSSIQVSIGGIYWVQINNNNCISNDTISVNLLNLPPGLEQFDSIFSCDNQATVGPLSSMFSYVWSTGSTNDSIVVSSSGYYWVSISNGVCETIDSVYVDFSGQIIEPFDINDTTICTNNTVNLNAGSGYSNYVWSTGATSSSISVSSSGTYWVQINNQNCTYTDSIMVNIFGLPFSGLTADSIFSCEAETSLVLIPGNSVIWSNGSTEDSISITNTGYYYVTINNGLCQTTDSVYVDFSGIISSASLEIPDSLTFCDGEVMDITANYGGGNYLWSTGASSQTISITEEGKYWVEVSNQYCKAADTLYAENISNDNFTVGNVFTPNGDGLNELFYTQLENIDKFHIQIWDRWGKPAFESDHKDFSWNGERGSEPIQGTYFWAITYNTLCNPDKQITKNGFVELLLDSN